MAVTVSEEYDDWRRIQGVQLWGRARRLTGVSRGQRALAQVLGALPFRQRAVARSRSSVGGCEEYRGLPRRAQRAQGSPTTPPASSAGRHCRSESE